MKEEEIIKVVYEMAPWKSPRPDAILQDSTKCPRRWLEKLNIIVHSKNHF